jgi:hypothetical protein
MQAAEVRTYIPEDKQTGRRHWVGKEEQREVVYATQQRLQRPKGKQAASEEAWRTDRADLRPLLRHGKHEANASAKTQQNSPTTVDPRRRNESGAAVIFLLL